MIDAITIMDTVIPGITHLKDCPYQDELPSSASSCCCYEIRLYNAGQFHAAMTIEEERHKHNDLFAIYNKLMDDLHENTT